MLPGIAFTMRRSPLTDQVTRHLTQGPAIAPVGYCLQPTPSVSTCAYLSKVEELSIEELMVRLAVERFTVPVP